MPLSIKSSGNAAVFYVDGTGVCRTTGQFEAPIYHATGGDGFIVMNGGVNKGNFNHNGRLNCTSIVSSGRITCDEISVTTNGLTVNGSINCGVINAGPVLASLIA